MEQFPPFWALKVSAHCDCACRECCWHDPLQESRELSLERWRHIIAQLAADGAIGVILEGGEPTMRSDLPDIAACAKAAGLLVVVATNGRLQGAPVLLASNPTAVVFSVMVGRDFATDHHGPNRLAETIQTMDNCGCILSFAHIVLGAQEIDMANDLVPTVAPHCRGILLALEQPFLSAGMERRYPRSVIERFCRVVKDLSCRFHILNSRDIMLSLGEPPSAPCSGLGTVLAHGERRYVCWTRLLNPQASCTGCTDVLFREAASICTPGGMQRLIQTLAEAVTWRTAPVASPAIPTCFP